MRVRLWKREYTAYAAKKDNRILIAPKPNELARFIIIHRLKHMVNR